jgi:hypothetical protein
MSFAPPVGLSAFALELLLKLALEFLLGWFRLPVDFIRLVELQGPEAAPSTNNLKPSKIGP